MLAGGRASRLDGISKPRLALAGVALIDRVLTALQASSVFRVAVVGPPDSIGPFDFAMTIVVTRENPPFQGPAAALAAGLAEVSADEVLVLACDLARVAEAVPILLATPLAHEDAVVLRDDEGRPQWLVGRYRRSALERAVDRARADGGGLDGLPLHRLLGDLDLLLVDDAGSSADIDTWHDLDRETSRLSAGTERTIP